MKVRVFTAIVTLPFLLVPIYFGGISLYILMFFISCVGFFEFLRAYKINQISLVLIGFVVTACYYLTLWFNNQFYFALLLGFFLVLLLINYIISFPKLQFQTIALTFTGFFYVTFLISHIILIREHASLGLLFVWLVFIIGFGSDTFAYFVGKTFGKHKLVPNLSPNKTIEGAFGGILGAVLLTAIYGYVMYVFGDIDSLSKLWWLALMGGIGSIVSQMGDLVASAIKRQTGIKDFGKLLPGHGGIIDRFDSNIFTAPFVYFIMVTLILK